MDYNGQELSKRRRSILNPIVVELSAKHEGLGFDDGKEKTMKNKTTFVKEKDMVYLAFSSKERDHDTFFLSIYMNNG
jgi:hypothetical protein